MAKEKCLQTKMSMTKTILQNRLSSLDAKHWKPSTAKRLRVFYGWAKVNKTRKKEAISVIFENDTQRDERTLRFINRMQTTVHVRDQTDREKIGIENAMRMFTEYSIFLSDKTIQGNLECALKYNSDADCNNVSQDERELIASKLRHSYLETHPGYKEPIIQTQLNFEQ